MYSFRGNLGNANVDAQAGLSGRGGFLFGFICFFQSHVSLDDLRNIFFGDFQIPDSFRPDHHIWGKSTDIHAATRADAKFSFQFDVFGDFFRLLQCPRGYGC
jgi:hypothetical protein